MATITHKRVYLDEAELVEAVPAWSIVTCENGREGVVRPDGVLVRPRTQVVDSDLVLEVVDGLAEVLGHVEPLKETRAQFIARVTEAPKATKRTRKAPKADPKAAKLAALRADLDRITAEIAAL